MRPSSQNHTRTVPPVEAFAGFAAPTSNTTFTPNQFFDVCLRFQSRGVVRLVAYLIRQTLGWCDAHGNPLHERLQVSYRELVEKAGISRGVIRKTLDEAIRGGFIECVQAGKASTAASKAVSAHYQLRWDDRAEYIKDPQQFRGFFEGEGNRTDIPNQYFDHVIPKEPLSVSKVVGSIIRFSIGFQAKHGRRRQQVSLSYRDIERYARLHDTHTLADAIRHAEANHYILRVEEGFFDTNAGIESRPAVFALRWADASPFFPTGSKTLAAHIEAERFKNPSGTGSKTPAANRFENPSDIETKSKNEISKQQQAVTQQAEALLRVEGFGKEVAKALASRFSLEQLQAQLQSLPERGPSQNRLGMLRRSIEESWPAPEILRHAEVLGAREFARHFYAGLAGNPGLPVAEPSSRDEELAGQFVLRLTAARPVKVEFALWAREFAAFVRERKHERDVPSLVLALRLHGDAWLLRFSRAQEEQRCAALDSEKAIHRNLHEKAWLEFIDAAERTCRTSKADEYGSFLKTFSSDRWRAKSSNPERDRLLAFQRHFQMPDFWHWDAEFNSQPFSPCA